MLHDVVALTLQIRLQRYDCFGWNWEFQDEKVRGILIAVNAGVDFYIAGRFGLATVNNWLLIVSIGLLSMAAYQVFLSTMSGIPNKNRLRQPKGRRSRCKSCTPAHFAD